MATFYNQATLSYSGGTVNSNITTGEILEVLSVTKTAVIDEYSDDSLVTYVINIVNSGSINYTNLTLTDDLGGYDFNGNTVQPLDYVEGSVKYFVNGIIQSAPTVTEGETLTVTGLNVPAGGNATVVYTARTNGFAPSSEEGTITNNVVISGGGIAEITASETITAVNEPILTITKSISPTTVAENGQITYTFVIQNSGNTPAVATDNVVITDTFDPILSNISVTYNSAVWVEPTNYTYNELTGVFETVAGQVTVPAATFSQDSVTGEWTTVPGVATITVTGII